MNTKLAETTFSRKKAGRRRTGTLYQSATGGWRLRLPVEVDGETIKKVFDLGTTSKAAARAKQRRLLATELPSQEEAERVETFQEAAERIVGADDIASKANRLGRLRNHVYPLIGNRPVTALRSEEITEVLQMVADAGYSRDLVTHVKHDIGAVIGKLFRTRILDENEMDRVEMPKRATVDTRHRAVLTDEEFVCYLGWQHPEEQHAMAVLERQVMACVSRMFGGVRIGDLRVLNWKDLDTSEGEFRFGYAPRAKTNQPQLLEIPAMLRPVLRDWWERHGRPTEGFVFPARKGERAGEVKGRSNVAEALRRDLMRAFGIEVPHVSTFVRSNGRPTMNVRWVKAREMTSRELELFEDSGRTKKLDFHSFRRAFKQGLANAGTDVQTALILSGSSDAKTHQRYLRNATQMKSVPANALPVIDIGHVQTKKATLGGDLNSLSNSKRLVGAGEEIRTLDVNLGKLENQGSPRQNKPLSAGSAPALAANSGPFGVQSPNVVSELDTLRSDLDAATLAADWPRVAQLAAALAKLTNQAI
jgi:integrase